MRNSLHQITGRLLLMACLLLSAIITTAQTPTGDGSEALKTQGPPALSLQIEPQQVKFTVQRAVVLYRFQVQNQTGEVVFDSGSVSEAELLWSLKDSNGSSLASGLYQYTLTIQEKADEAARTQRGHFIIERADDRTADRVWVTTQDASGISVNGAQVTAARDGQELTAGARGEQQTSPVTRDSSGRTVAETASVKKTPGDKEAISSASTGTAGRIAKWLTTQNLGDSIISESGSVITVAGNVDVTGSYRQGGENALRLDTPRYNTFIGAAAGNANPTGTSNTFSGYDAGRSNTSGNSNTFTGMSAGGKNTTGSGNTFSGVVAGFSNTEGYSNTFTGANAGMQNIDGSFNTFTGRYAGYGNLTGFYNTFSGVNAGYSNTKGTWNTFTGVNAGRQNTEGNDNTFTGSQAGFNNLTGSWNTFTGVNAGYSNQTGYANTFSGYKAGEKNLSGIQNTFSGYLAGFSNTTASSNTFNGVMAGYKNMTGAGNTFSGATAGYSNITGGGNTFTGFQAGYSTTSYNNTFTGFNAGFNNGAGLSNTFTGKDAGFNNQSGDGNTFIGVSAGYYNLIGWNNTFIGTEAGYYTTGHLNTFIGESAGRGNTTGYLNTFIGGTAGRSNTIGIYNTAIGYNANVGVSNFNATAVGTDSEASCSNCIVLGSINGVNSSTSNTRVGIGTNMPNASYLLHVNGAVLATSFTPSDARYKRDIQVLPHALQTVLRLRGISYDFNRAAYPAINFANGRQMGFLAQEVEAVLPEVVSKDQEGYYALNYSAFAPLLTEAVKEQQQMIESLQQENSRLLKRLETVERTLLRKKRSR